MFTTKGAIVWGLIALAVGAVLIVCCHDITTAGIIEAAAILFICAGIVNGAMTMFVKEDKSAYLARKKADDKKGLPTVRERKIRGLRFTLNIIASACAVAFGVVLLVMTPTFMGIVPVVLALLILFMSLMQFYTLAIGARPVMLPGWLYIFPALMLVGCIMVYMLETDPDIAEAQQLADQKTMIYTGASLLLYGMCSILTGIFMSRAHRKMRLEHDLEHEKGEPAAHSAASDKTALPDKSDLSEQSDKPDKSAKSASAADSAPSATIKPLE